MSQYMFTITSSLFSSSGSLHLGFSQDANDDVFMGYYRESSTSSPLSSSCVSYGQAYVKNDHIYNKISASYNLAWRGNNLSAYPKTPCGKASFHVAASIAFYPNFSGAASEITLFAAETACIHTSVRISGSNLNIFTDSGENIVPANYLWDSTRIYTLELRAQMSIDNSNALEDASGSATASIAMSFTGAAPEVTITG